jgi:ElaB/YqjD/DUF883 family membrane-anchored ribosome-binding protein
MQIKSDFSQPAANRSADGILPAIVAVEGATSGVTNEFHNFVADMEDLVSKTTSVTGEELTRVKAKLSARIAAAKLSIEEMGTTVIQRTRQAATVTNNYVHEQPWQAIGIGAAAGVLLGFVLGRRK